jgi:hypothetical protein
MFTIILNILLIREHSHCYVNTCVFFPARPYLRKLAEPSVCFTVSVLQRERERERERGFIQALVLSFYSCLYKRKAVLKINKHLESYNGLKNVLEFYPNSFFLYYVFKCNSS